MKSAQQIEWSPHWISLGRDELGMSKRGWIKGHPETTMFTLTLAAGEEFCSLHGAFIPDNAEVNMDKCDEQHAKELAEEYLTRWIETTSKTILRLWLRVTDATLLVTRWKHPACDQALILEGTKAETAEDARLYFTDEPERLEGTEEAMLVTDFRRLREFQS